MVICGSWSTLRTDRAFSLFRFDFGAQPGEVSVGGIFRRVSCPNALDEFRDWGPQ